MRRMKITWASAVSAALASVLLAGAPAAAADDDANGFADDNYNGFREVVGEGDDAYWSVTIRRGGAYIATWERDPKNGVWESPEQALEAINAAQKCVGEVQLAFLRQFTTHEQFAAHPSAALEWLPDGTFTWRFADGSAEQQEAAACSEEDPWTTEHVTIVEADDPELDEIQIPLTTLGPGTHELFFVEVESLPSLRHDYANGAWTGYTAGYEAVGEAQWVTVAVPEPTSDAFPYTTIVENGALTDPSALARSAPPFLDDEPAAIGAAALPALGGALALTALIAVPTALIRARSSSASSAAPEGDSV